MSSKVQNLLNAALTLFPVNVHDEVDAAPHVVLNSSMLWSLLPRITSVATRWMASSALLAWMVASVPRWPVFMASSSVLASGPRTSPTFQGEDCRWTLLA